MSSKPICRISIVSSAKINLFLEVLAKRKDGYHDLETLMASVSIYDLLSFSPTTSNKIVLNRVGLCGDVSQVSGMTTDRENLIYRALELVRQTAGSEFGARISICKRIPTQAGLGGASSNAAAAILAANRMWNLNWPITRLRELAAKIGSDVAFFLGGGLALCTGRGEKVKQLHFPCSWHVVVAKPPEGFATSEIYSRCEVPSEPIKTNALLDGLRTGNLSRIGRHLFNRLQKVASGVSQWVDRLAIEFARTTAVVGHQLTGSGSCYFGMYPNGQTARIAAKRLSNRLPNVSFYNCRMMCARNSANRLLTKRS